MTTLASNGSHLVTALKLILNHCDGARTWDGAGFSSYDAGFARSLIEGFDRYGSLTEKGFPYAQKLVHKYRKQLLANGYSPMEMDRLAALVFQKGEPRPKKVEEDVTFLAFVQNRTDKGIRLRYSDTYGVMADQWFPAKFVTIGRTVKARLNTGRRQGVVETEQVAARVPAWIAKDKGVKPGSLEEINAKLDKAEAEIGVEWRVLAA